MSRVRSILGKGLLGSLSTLFMLAVLEIGLRIFGPPAPPPEDTLRTYTEYDPTLGWKGKASAHGRYSTSVFSVEVVLNSGGWRDEEPPSGERSVASSRSFAEAAPQVAVLGDSFAWGYGVERAERFSDRLETALPGWNVRNYGVCGYGTDQELLVLRQSVLQTAPKLIIVEFAIGNDLDNIASAHAYRLPKPRFVLSSTSLQLQGVPVPRTENWQRAARTGLRDFLTAHLRIYAWVRPRWGRLQGGVLRALKLARNDAGERAKLRIYEREATERVQRGWELAEAILGEIHDEAEGAGAHLIVLAVADRIQVEDPLWENVLREVGVDPARYDRDLPDRRLREIAGRLGILIVDPLARQRDLARKGRSLFLPEDRHWNAEGHAVAAEALREAIAPILPSLAPIEELPGAR